MTAAKPASHVAAPYYDGVLADGTAIGMSDVCRAWRLGRELSNAVKYLLRAGRKGPAGEDFGKAVDYLAAALHLHAGHGPEAVLVPRRVGGPFNAEDVATAFGATGDRALALAYIARYQRMPLGHLLTQAHAAVLRLRAGGDA